MVALRIGYFAAKPLTGPDAKPRDRAAWLSPRDCAELIRAAVEAERITFAVANGTSANGHLHADLADTCAALGYQPLHDAWAMPD